MTHMTATEERSLPKPDVHRRRGGREGVPGLDVAQLQLLHAAEAQAEPLRGRHRRGAARPAALPQPGLALRVLRRPRRLPAGLDGAQGVGQRPPEPERYPGSGGKGYDWPAHGWHEFRDPNEEWELTFYRYNANVVRQLNQNVETARQTKAFEQWNPNWVRLRRAATSAPGCTSSTASGLYVFANANRRAPTNMHNNAISVNSMHRIRFAQDLALYNLTLTEEIEGFDGARAPGGLERRPGLAGRPRGRRAADLRRRLGRGDLRHQHRVRAAGRRAVPQPAGAAGGARRTATSSPRRSSAPASTTTPSATCATPSRCSTC